jgi:XTP/dITP diphosphohydrolase
VAKRPKAGIITAVAIMTEPIEIFFATGNAHKVAEMQALANDSQLALRLRSAKDAGGMPAVVEDSGTFLGNARKKARALHAQLQHRCWVLSDDSGLCADALGGAPGVESAHYAGPGATSAANLALLLAKLVGVPREQRTAHFICVLFVIEPGGREHNFIGRCDGRLLEHERGHAGFGYDPIFVPAESHLTFAELGEAVKNGISHRARAWAKFADWWRVRAAV